MSQQQLTQKQEVLAHLQNNGPIDLVISLSWYGIPRLSSCIAGLRKQGYNIKSREITRNTSRGKEFHLHEYYME